MSGEEITVNVKASSTLSDVETELITQRRMFKSMERKFLFDSKLLVSTQEVFTLVGEVLDLAIMWKPSPEVMTTKNITMVTLI